MQSAFRATRLMGAAPTRTLQARTAQALRSQVNPTRLMHQSRVLREVPKEEHSAHTISQRIRTLKKIPMELLPLAFVMVVALGAAGFSIARKLWVDKTLRLSRSGGVSHRNQEPKADGGH